jgi:hypothetical protein
LCVMRQRYIVFYGFVYNSYKLVSQQTT